MPSEAAVSSMIEGLMVLCKEKLQPGEQLSAVESEDSVRLSRSLKEGEAFMDDFHAVANSSSMWSSVLKALEEDPLELSARDPKDASELATSLASHDQRLVGAMLCCMELMVEINPANISFVVLSMHRIFGSQMSPSIILELLQNYRGHFPYSYMFIRRIGRSPKAPISVWKDALLSFGEPMQPVVSSSKVASPAKDGEGKFKKTVSFSDLDGGRDSSTPGSPAVSNQLHSVLSDDELYAMGSQDESYEDDRGRPTLRSSSSDQGPGEMHAPSTSRSKHSDWLVSDSEEGEDSDPDEAAALAAEEEEKSRSAQRHKPRLTRMSASPSRKAAEDKKTAPREAVVAAAPAAVDNDLMEVEDLSFHEEFKSAGGPKKMDTADASSSRPVKSLDSGDAWARGSSNQSSQVAGSSTTSSGNSSKVTVVAKLPNTSATISQIGDIEDDMSDEEQEHEDIIDEEDLRKEFQKVLIAGSSDVANKVSLSRKVRFVLGASQLADRISRHSNSEISWIEVLGLAGLPKKESDTKKVEPTVVAEPVKQTKVETVVQLPPPNPITSEKARVVESKAVEAKGRSREDEDIPKSSSDRDSKPSPKLVPDNITTPAVVASAAAPKQATPAISPVVASSPAVNPPSPVRSETPPHVNTPVRAPTINATRSQSPNPIGPSPPRAANSSSNTDPLTAARSIFASIDRNGDGIVSHIELIKALRANPQLAKSLNLPSEIRQEDGSRDSYMYNFAAMDTDGSGNISQSEFMNFVLMANAAKSSRDAETDREARTRVPTARSADSPIAAAKLSKRIDRHVNTRAAVGSEGANEVSSKSAANQRPQRASSDVEARGRRNVVRADVVSVLDKMREARKRTGSTSPSRLRRSQNGASELDHGDSSLRRSDPMARNLRRIIGGEENDRPNFSDTLATTRSYPDSRATLSSTKDFSLSFPPEVMPPEETNQIPARAPHNSRPQRPPKPQVKKELPYPFAMLNLPISALHLDNLSQLAQSTGVLCEGYMEKKSHLLGIWQKRYFILARRADGSAELQIYAKASPSAWGNIPIGLRRIVLLDNCDSLELVQDKKQIGTLFKITERVSKGKTLMQRLLNKSSSASTASGASSPTQASGAGGSAASQPQLGSTGTSGDASDKASDAGSVMSDAELDGMRVVTLRAVSAQVRQEWVAALRRELSNHQ